MKLKHLLSGFALFLGLAIFGQAFSPAFNGFSKKKTTYITMKDGTEMSVNIKKLSYKKGLIEEIKVVKAGEETKVKIDPEDISHMYIPPSNLAKLSQVTDAAYDVTKLMDNELSSEHLEDGYLYMESSNVQIKKNKTQYSMLQLMNPTFSKNIKVYNDPLASETASIGVGPMTVAGGLDKSYYIKKDGEDIAKQIKKKEFKQDIEILFSDCPELVKKYGDKPNWEDFEQFIYEYSTTCE